MLRRAVRRPSLQAAGTDRQGLAHGMRILSIL